MLSIDDSFSSLSFFFFFYTTKQTPHARPHRAPSRHPSLTFASKDIHCPDSLSLGCDNCVRMTSLVKGKNGAGKKAKKRPSNLQIKKPQEYSKAQKNIFMQLCSNSKVRPDTEFVNHLPDQVLYFPNLDNAGEKELDIVGILTGRMTKTKHIKYGCIVPSSADGDDSMVENVSYYLVKRIYLFTHQAHA